MDTETAITLARRLYQALAQGDRTALDECLHPDLAGHATPGLPAELGGEYASASTMRRDFWGRIGEDFDAQAYPSDFRGLDDGGLLVIGHYRGRGRQGGPLDAEFMHLLAFRDGRISALTQLTDSHRWHEALTRVGRSLPTIDYVVCDGLATITLDRPRARNAINLDLVDELLDVARRCAADTSIRAVLIEGNGPDLTVGGDIACFGSVAPDELAPLLRRMTGPFHEAFRILSRLPAPIVTAAHGAVAGGGLGFVYAADVVVAADDAAFLTAFGALGLTGDGGGTWHLPRLVGARRAAKMYLENHRLEAAEALEWGLIDEVVPVAELRVRARARARTLADGPTKAYAGMRELLRSSWTNSLSEQLLDETEVLATAAQTSDAHQAIAAFRGKQRFTFEGR